MTTRRPYSIPDNEALRLEKLRDYQILDTHSEDTFDKIALLAAQIFNTPSAFINFVDADRVFIKSSIGFDEPISEVPREDSLCSRAILKDSASIFHDTHHYPELMDNPHVAAEGGIRFYASAPLKTPEGFIMGTICVVDYVPRDATDAQLTMLKTLSSIIIDKLENRLRYRKSIESQVNLMNIALHEIKNPLASIKLANEIIIKSPVNSVERMTENIKSAVTRIQAKLSDLLKQSELEEKDMMLNVEEVDLNEMFARLLYNFELLAQRKDQTIEFYCDEALPVLEADRTKISDVLHNLLSNAIKYSYPGTVIKLSAREAGNYVHIEVKDEGQGLNFSDMQKLFTKFAKLSSKPTGKETSNGLGLSITKSFIELHNGNIYAMSPGKDKGTTFIVSIPFKHKKTEELAEVSEYNS